MFSTQTYQSRREALRRQVGSGIILLPGNNEMPMNYRANTYPFRQDSHFLYFFGLDQPHLAGILDTESGEDWLFGDELTMEDIIWTGPQPGLKDRAGKVGVSRVLPYKELPVYLLEAASKGREIHFTPPYRHDTMIFLSRSLGISFDNLKDSASLALIRAIVAQRSVKSEEELAEMDRAVDISGAMHVAVMQAAKPGQQEAALAGIAAGIATGLGGQLAYGIILSVQGQILHNHHYGNTLRPGQLLLGDHGAETALHYAGDLTRTCPVSPAFTTRQKEIYEIVLGAETAAIDGLRPGRTYLDVHLEAARNMAEGLKSLGLMKGDMAEAVSVGAHALFFPHGLGHMIGLDVHDMEDLGEDHVGYSEQVQRSKLFGTAYLRMGRALEPGFTLTVEPGLYFIPELIDLWRSEGKFKDFIAYEILERWRDFGGIRIEDNVVVTDSGARVLGNPVPKTVAAVEALRSGSL
ncbi:MAG: hypothetical protein RLY31_644 [Bacteroidota bacterium]|jgi:Xaa-Pro aminopeptidase